VYTCSRDHTYTCITAACPPPPPRPFPPAESSPDYRGTSLIRNSAPLGPYSSICLGLYGVPSGGGCFLRARYPCNCHQPSRQDQIDQSHLFPRLILHQDWDFSSCRQPSRAVWQGTSEIWDWSIWSNREGWWCGLFVAYRLYIVYRQVL